MNGLMKPSRSSETGKKSAGSSRCGSMEYQNQLGNFPKILKFFAIGKLCVFGAFVHNQMAERVFVNGDLYFKLL